MTGSTGTAVEPQGSRRDPRRSLTVRTALSATGTSATGKLTVTAITTSGARRELIRPVAQTAKLMDLRVQRPHAGLAVRLPIVGLVLSEGSDPVIERLELDPLGSGGSR